MRSKRVNPQLQSFLSPTGKLIAQIIKMSLSLKKSKRNSLHNILDFSRQQAHDDEAVS